MATVPVEDLPAVTDALRTHLDEFAGALPARENLMLFILLLRAMDPIDRIQFTAPGLLSDDQEGILKSIETGG